MDQQEDTSAGNPYAADVVGLQKAAATLLMTGMGTVAVRGQESGISAFFKNLVRIQPSTNLKGAFPVL